jgi:hypothetical protein
MRCSRPWDIVEVVFVLLLLSPVAARGEITDTCDATLWNHVYHPDRLVKIHPCVWITGKIVLLRKEKDGDVHIQIRVDPKYKPLLNATNKARQGGNLVLEPVCVGKVTQADAKQPCAGFTNTVTIPKRGDRVKVTGSYVHDVETNHGWMELHPVTSIEPD